MGVWSDLKQEYKDTLPDLKNDLRSIKEEQEAKKKQKKPLSPALRAVIFVAVFFNAWICLALTATGIGAIIGVPMLVADVWIFIKYVLKSKGET